MLTKTLIGIFMIQVKNLKVLESLMMHPAHPKLIELIQWCCIRHSQTVITGGYEWRGYSSVHSTIPFRGLDIRSRVFNDPQGVVDDINRHWTYDPKRSSKKCAIYHDMGRGPHIHLQVHQRTERVDKLSGDEEKGIDAL